MSKSRPLDPDTVRAIAIRALGFITGEEAVLRRFLDVTGWTPASLVSPGSRTAILTAALDYLMSEEDLLLTFSANSGLDPRDVARAHHELQGGGEFLQNPEG